MSPLEHLNAYIERHGGTGPAARRLSLPYPTLYAIRTGLRGISPRMAERIERASGGELLKERLVWVRAADTTTPLRAAS